MVSRVTARQVEEADYAVLEANLRPADRAEVEASRGDDIGLALRRAVRASDQALVFEYRGKILAVFGVVTVSLFGPVGCPWMLGTTALDRYPGALMFQSRRYLADMLKGYRELENYVDARNTKSIRWLRRLGFTLYEPVPMGLHKLPFYKFGMRV